MKKKNDTPLDRISAQLRVLLWHQTTDVIEIGKLLIESREHLQHGEWQSWLAENFDLSIRSAQNYVAAAEYVTRKSATFADFSNLAPTVLYALAADHYNEREEAAILAATTHKERVGEARAAAICAVLRLPDDAAAAGGAVSGDSGDETTAAEIAAIIDGPSPAVPTPPPPDLRDFDQAISELKRLRTKPLAQFARTTHSADDLEGVEAFIRDVTEARADAGAHRRGAEREQTDDRQLTLRV